MTSAAPFRRIGIVGQTRDPALDAVAERLQALASEHDLELRPEEGIREILPGHQELVPGEVDLLVSFGGDGTLLRGARSVARHHTPVLGVNLGHLGFLTSVGPEEFEDAFRAVLTGNFQLDTRYTLTAWVTKADGTRREEHLALNDAVLHKGGFARVIRMAVYLGEEREEVGEYTADGIILATPTGSTAYSLSAGGGIVAPEVDCLLATPICPHTLAVRPLVLPSDTVIEVEVREPQAEVVLTLDGQEGEALAHGDRLTVQRGDATVPLVRFPDQSFFSTLRRKLHWGIPAATDPEPDKAPGPHGDPPSY